MKITMKNLKHFESLSEETNAFTATIYVDGVRAFDASNHGQGGPDMYYPVKGYTGPSEADINEWLKNNTPKIKYNEIELDNSLDLVVGDLIEDQLKMKKFKRILNSKIVIIEKENNKDVLYTYNYKPTPEMISKMEEAIANGKVKGRIVNGANDAIMEEALRAF